MIRLLLYSQDINLQFLLAPTLGAEFSVFLERRMDGIREIISQGRCDVLIVDLDSRSCPMQQQLGFFDEIRDFGVPVVVMTDDDSRTTAMDMVQRGVNNYIRKPPALQELKIVVRRAHEFAVLKQELENVRRRLPSSGCDELIGASARSQVVYDLVRRVADLEASVLITGESGTGKELIARAIHNLGQRKGRPFIAVSCGAIPETLIEAELFGAEKGAYTGAAVRRRGYLEEVGNGTLFFDEIGECSPYTQVKLLRVLQEREFSRLGSSQPIPLQARLAVRHSPGFGRDGRGRNVSPGPLLPSERNGHQIARHSAITRKIFRNWPSIFWRSTPGSISERTPELRRRRWRCCWNTSGRETSGNWRMSFRAPSY